MYQTVLDNCNQNIHGDDKTILKARIHFTHKC